MWQPPHWATEAKSSSVALELRRGDDVVKTISLAGRKSYVLGRQGDIVVEDAGASRQHAAIVHRDGAAYLGTSDLYGTMYEDTFIATGLGAHMALPLLRQEWTAEMGEAEARALLTKCMQVLFYRDTRACSTIQIGKVDATGSSISAPTKLETYWEHPEFIKGGGHRGDGSW